MPIYEYRCAKCGTEAEIHCPFDDASAPVCCGQPMERRYGAFAFVMK